MRLLYDLGILLMNLLNYNGINRDRIEGIMMSSVVPQINFGSGQLDQPNALVFDGFGKILDFTVAGLYK